MLSEGERESVGGEEGDDGDDDGAGFGRAFLRARAWAAHFDERVPSDLPVSTLPKRFVVAEEPISPLACTPWLFVLGTRVRSLPTRRASVSAAFARHLVAVALASSSFCVLYLLYLVCSPACNVDHALVFYSRRLRRRRGCRELAECVSVWSCGIAPIGCDRFHCRLPASAVAGRCSSDSYGIRAAAAVDEPRIRWNDAVAGPIKWEGPSNDWTP